jgi:hypothetical protein
MLKAAIAPDEGETVAQMFYKDQPHALAPKLAADAWGFIWMPDEELRLIAQAAGNCFVLRREKLISLLRHDDAPGATLPVSREG